MKKNALKTLSLVCIVTLMSCIQNKKPTENKIVEKSVETVNSVKQAPHNYGGWYCPDNLNGFPAVDLLNWKNVPVVNGRLATKEETQNGTSLIFVDTAKYPDARPLDIEMPNYAGYEIVSFFKEINFEIIFVTAYDQYAIKAFEISAVDYLLKPVDIEELKIALQKVYKTAYHHYNNGAYKQSMSLIDSALSSEMENAFVDYLLLLRAICFGKTNGIYKYQFEDLP